MNVLIAVDLQNDFITGALGTAEAAAILPRAERRIREFEGTVFFTRDTHGADYPDTREGKMLPVPHCIKGTEGWELAPCLLPPVGEVIDKPTFGSTLLGERLRRPARPAAYLQPSGSFSMMIWQLRMAQSAVRWLSGVTPAQQAAST